MRIVLWGDLRTAFVAGWYAGVRDRASTDGRIEPPSGNVELDLRTIAEHTVERLDSRKASRKRPSTKKSTR